MLKLSILLPMANDELHSSLSDDISIQEKQLTAICWYDARRKPYAQTVSHDGDGGGDDDDLVGVEYAGESSERGRRGGGTLD